MSKTFESCMEVAASAKLLFQFTQDYERRLDWDPFLCEASLLHGATQAGLGVRAWCVSKSPKLGMETEYVSFQPPKVCAVKMTKGPSVFQSFAGSWRFEPQPNGNTLIHFRYSLTTRPAWLRPMIAWVFDREMKARLLAIKTYVETSP
jgi:ribosome-associated toxin RatA of RatAB toxin-antitoxin module